jgi:beta-lactamase regulating signal transducer with metallopeptidase domain
MTHHWEALGWTLIHFCWQAAAIAIVYRLADLTVAKGRTQARYVLALAALLGMLAASIGTLAYEESSYHHSVALAASSASRAIPAVQIIPRPLAVIDMPSAPRHAAKLLANDVMPYLDLFWLAGVVCLTLRTIGGWWLIRRLRHSALQKAPHTLRIGLDRIRLQMGIPRFVDLRLSSRIAGPLTVGVIRPLILLPITALTSLSPEQLEVVLAHELAHIRRADYFWNILQTMIETLFFFHPAVWWISRRLRDQRELCCDDIAVQTCQDPAVYAAALLRLEEERKMHLHLAMALDGNQSGMSLRSRILRILGDPEEQPRDFKPLSLAGMVALLVLFICPLPQVFASFKAAPKKVSASFAHVVHRVPRPHAAIKATHVKPFIAAPASSASPSPAPAPMLAPAALSIISADGNMLIASQDAASQSSTSGKSDYIDQMRAAGYDVDMDKYVAMKIQGITPEYAAAMAKATGKKPSANELIALKIQNVTPEYMSGMRAAGYDADMNKFIAMKVQDITPEYADAMAKVGFGKPSADELIAMKVQGVTPDYAAKLHADGIEVNSFKDLISYRIFNVSPEFVAGMKEAGFSNIPAKKLLTLRVQGVTPEFAKGAKAQFPEATVDDLVQMKIFNIDGDFIASAKRHGFTPLTVQKLVKLRISGILDDNDAKAAN